MVNIDTKQLLSIQNELKSRVKDLRGRKILVVGDIGLDEYVLGEVKRISPEAPVPVLDVNSEDTRVGLAGNVAQNIVSLGGEALLIGVIGKDSAGQKLKELLQKSGVNCTHLLEDQNRPTTRKMRIMAEHHHIVRVDYETRKFLEPAVEQQLLSKLKNVMDQVDGVIIEDYGKGVFSEAGTQKVIQLAHQFGKKVLVDPHRTTPLNYYTGADLFKPNKDEAFLLSGLELSEIHETDESYREVAQALIEKLGAKYLVMTRGKLGMSLFMDGKEGVLLPTYARQVFDVTGAGDTVLAALGLAWFGGFELEKACVLANFAAGVVVGKVGCVPCQISELLEHIDQHIEDQVV